MGETLKNEYARLTFWTERKIFNVLYMVIFFAVAGNFFFDYVVQGRFHFTLTTINMALFIMVALVLFADLAPGISRVKKARKKDQE